MAPSGIYIAAQPRPSLISTVGTISRHGPRNEQVDCITSDVYDTKERFRAALGQFHSPFGVTCALENRLEDHACRIYRILAGRFGCQR